MKTPSAAASNDAFPPDVRDFIASLNANRVEYVLIGGYALAVYGVVRATVDIDFLYRRTKANVGRLVKALGEFGAPETVIDQSSLLKPGIVTQFGYPPARIDLLSTIDGVTFDEVWKGMNRVKVDDEALPVIGLTELLANKSATRRRKDQADVRALKAKAKAKKHLKG